MPVPFSLILDGSLPLFFSLPCAFRSSERCARDVEAIARYLQKWRCMDSFSNALLRRLASIAYLEDLDDGVTRNHNPTKLSVFGLIVYGYSFLLGSLSSR